MQEITIKTENLSKLIDTLNIAIHEYIKNTSKCFFGLTEDLDPKIYEFLEYEGYKTSDEKYEFLKDGGELLNNIFDQLLEEEKKQNGTRNN